ncbi:MAG: trehalose-6-phosphate synthase [Stagnimonas sp.]|nr:trehalose-6-phosphate synthase [Stagnimonas sp.]
MSGGKGRLIAVSNRVGPIRDTPQAGGLAVALVDALRERGGLWFGFGGKLAAHPREAVQLDSFEGLHTATIELNTADYHSYYNGHANGCLWPLFHFRPDLVHYRRDDYAAYLRINQRFADALAPLLQDDDILWIHDFHLIPLASMLRARGCRQRIGFYLHIPFPALDLLLTLPNHLELLQQLSAYDLIGVQTPVNLDRLHDCFTHLLGLPQDGNCWQTATHTLRTGVFPVGIDVETFEGFATQPRAVRTVNRMRAELRNRTQIIGVDRLDYAKGLLRRLEAYERFLEQHPRAHGRVEYLQLAPVSRGEVGAYQDFREQMERDAARINGRYSRYDWTPLRYLNSPLSRATLAALYRASAIGFVTPLRDGMNLVAKEYVAAQDPEDPGVLVLSLFAGAAHQMNAAVIANPYDSDAVADALETARVMPLAERRERHAELLKGLHDYDARRWQHDYLDVLSQNP